MLSTRDFVKTYRNSLTYILHMADVSLTSLSYIIFADRENASSRDMADRRRKDEKQI